jgi:lipid A ethanolaminephosphotransferase
MNPIPLRDDTAPASRRFTIPASVEQVILVASVFWVLAANRLFFGAATSGHVFSAPSTWGFVLALAVALVALHFLLLGLVATRWTLKPLLAVLIVVTAFAVHFMQSFGVYLDPTMLRNVLRTDVGEARELLSLALIEHLLLYAGLPLFVLSRVRLVRRPWRRALLVRFAALALALGALVAALLSVFQPFASLTRNHKEVRYLITPANYLWSLGSVAVGDLRAAVPHQAIGLDARPAGTWLGARPRVVVLVVGETARAANWGLDGYARQTTPQLAATPGLINFRRVGSCGTSTEVSLPCMFAPVGRRDYDESRIRSQDSLLDVVARAGVGVHWRDNQSGCKGVCARTPSDTVSSQNAPGLCNDERCLDEGLLLGIDEQLAKAQGTQFIVLHQLGSHGPSYFRRYPKAFARFQPACENDDLRLCSREEIVNAYDNSLLYTDHVLASLVAKLQAAADRVDTALVYVSDHGESLGENNLFLHGIPYAIAPDEQTHVPMVMWMSEGFAQAGHVDLQCMKKRAAEPASHDHLFHTLLDLLDVRTSLYAGEFDLMRGCRETPDHMARR